MTSDQRELLNSAIGGNFLPDEESEAIKACLEERDAFLAMLVSLEWSVEDDDTYCPECSNMRGQGHDRDCELGALLARVKGETNA